MTLLRKEAVKNIIALTPLQKGILYHSLNDETGLLYFEQLSLNITGKVHLPHFQQAWHHVIDINEALRSIFIWENIHDPIQVILKKQNLQIARFDISDAESEEERKRLLEEIKRKDRQERFDLQSGPLFRIILCKLFEEKYTMIISNHHIICDGWSNGIIIKEFLHTYSQLQEGLELVQVTKPQYQEYVRWIQEQDLSKQQNYWKKYLERFDGELLPPEDSDIEAESLGIEKYSTVFPENVKVELEKVAKELQITPSIFFYAAWGMLLQRYTNNNDVIFGVTVATREWEGTRAEDMVGLLINTIPLRIQITGEESIKTLLQILFRELQESRKYEMTPLTDIQSYGNIDPRQGIFRSIMVVENYPLDMMVNDNSKLKIDSFSNHSIINYDLTFAIPMYDEIGLDLLYNAKMYSQKTIHRLVTQMQKLLEQMIDDPESKVLDLELLDSSEKEQLLVEWNRNEAREFEGKNVLDLFEHQVATKPEQRAVVFAGQNLTYRELNDRANQVASLLRIKGVQAEQVVGIMVEPSLEMFVGILGILKAGAAYMPIDPTYPVDRIEYMVQDSHTQIILSKYHLVKKFRWNGEWIDLTNKSIYQENITDLSVEVNPENLAYIIYTSGSTGRPKGVMIEHRSFANSVQWFISYYHVDWQDQTAMYASFSFDASIMEIFPFLSCGATVHVLQEEKYNLYSLNDYYEAHQITVAFLPTKVAEEFMNLPNTSLRYLLAGGEKLNSFSPTNYQLVNNYGPTENTVVATVYPVHKQEKNIPIGKPIDNIKVYVLDQWDRIQPIGLIGELCISGKGLARGYLNKENLTAERFTANPRVEGERIYRTGDLVRWRYDGNLEYVGRADHQVKVRGYRIELGEIEASLRNVQGIQNSVVVDQVDASGNVCLIAYILSNEEVNSEEIKKILRKELPSFMIPDYFITIAQIPLTVNGKVDYQSLPAPEQSFQHYVELNGEVQEKLGQIWSVVFGVDEIGATDNLFDLGGHSLNIIQLVSQIYKEFKVKVSPKELFENPTIEEMEILILHEKNQKFLTIEPVETRKFYPTSSAQKRLYFLDQMSNNSTIYNIPSVLKIDGELDQGRLNDVINELAERHEALRTFFVLQDGELVQAISDMVDVKIKVSQTNRNDMENNIQAFIQPFDLGQAPLFRINLLKVEDEVYLLFDIHHSIADGMSIDIFIQELMKLYNGEKLEEVKIQYKDFAIWQNRLLDSDRILDYKEFWLGQFTDKIPNLNLVPDFSYAQTLNFEGDKVVFSIGKDLKDKLTKLSQETGSTLFMVLLASYNLFCSKYTNQEDITVGVPVFGRNHPELNKTIGMFVNTLALRNYPTRDKSFLEFLEEVKLKFWNASENQDYQFDMLVEDLKLGNMGENPLFDTMFSLQKGISQIELKSFKMSIWDFKHAISKFPLTLMGYTYADRLEFIFEYRTVLFHKETVKRFATHLISLLEGIVAHPEQKLGDFEVLSNDEKKQLLLDFNDTKTDYPREQTIIQLFEAQVEQKPNQIALFFNDQKMTYHELNAKANQLARRLCEQEVQPGMLVGLLTERSFEMIIGILGILKSGAAFLPIHPKDPINRIEYILKDSGISLVVGQQHIANKVTMVNEFININDPEIVEGDMHNLDIINKASDLAYVIYTSGTTGLPKGNLISQRSVNRTVKNINYLEINDQDRFLQLSNYAFDGSVFDIFGALLNGASLVLISEDEILDIKKLIEVIKQNGVTIFFITTSLFNAVVDFNIEALKGVRKILFGGEKASVKHVQKAFHYLGKDHLINVYGPTEITVFTTYYPINEVDVTKDIPIGKPISNTQVYILNDLNQLQPVGVIGELCISGDGLAKGYLNRAKLTHEKFVPNPFVPGELMYRSGDLVRWLPDGNIEFVGRKDNQVKLRGYRIELSEIEKVMLTYEGVKEVVVLDEEEEKKGKYLCAYLVANQPINVNLLKSSMVEKLPFYMVPSEFVFLPKIPLTPNGKVDRQVLGKSKPEAKVSKKENYEAPQGEIEEKLAQIWSSILGIDLVSRHDNFFDLGGHSLKVVQLLAKVHKEFQVQLSIKSIFQNASFQTMIEMIQREDQNKYLALEKVPEQEYYPVSSAQWRMFILNQTKDTGIAYNIPNAFYITGKLDFDRFERALQRIIEIHESFRTGFYYVMGEIVQKVYSEVSFKLEVLDVQEDQLHQTVKECVQPFALDRPPLFRVFVIKTLKKQVVVFDMHHIISDGYSMNILVRDFMQLYQGKEIQERSFQYKEFVHWHNKMLQSEKMQKQEAYWLEVFESELPVLNLPTDYPRPSMVSFEGGQITIQLGEDLQDCLNHFAVKQGVTPFMLYLAVYTVLLAKYTGQEDIVVGTPIAGRTHADLDQIIGMFINTLALYNAPTGTKSFARFLSEVKENALQAYHNQDYQFEMLVEKLNLTWDTSRNPLFDTLFTFQNVEKIEVMTNEFQLTKYPLDAYSSKFDLNVRVVEEKQGIQFILEYNKTLFKEETIQRLGTHFLQLLTTITENPDIQIADMSILSTEDKKYLMEGLNATESDYPLEKSIHQLFEEQVEKNSARVAVVDTCHQLTYAELNTKANDLARTLQQKGIGIGSKIGILLNNSADVVISMLAILKVGGTYLPIEPSYPVERIDFMIQDCDIQVILTKTDLAKKFHSPVDQILLDHREYQVGQPKKVLSNLSDLAYVIYTSGSTGTPKGVAISHKSLVNYVSWFIRQGDIQERDISILLSSFAFDLGYTALWSTLLSGATLHMVTEEIYRDGDIFHDYLSSNSITYIKATPSLFNILINCSSFLNGGLSSLRLIVLGGEKIRVNDVERYLYWYPNTQFMNHYGPTEATIGCVSIMFDQFQFEDYKQRPVIGKPISNMKAYIVDDNNHLVPVGVVGELCVSGDGLASGYINQPKLTAERFIDSPFAVDEKLYRTGDLAKWHPDGTIEFMMRVDNQVKIRGFRVEIGEVEKKLISMPSIVEAAVIARKDRNGDQNLAAFIISDEELNISELRSSLIKILPQYMIPSYFVQVPTIPLMANGKVDCEVLNQIEIKSVKKNIEIPKTENEKKLVKIWEKVLEITPIGVRDNFFDLGGHSLTATRLTSWIYKEFNVQVPLREIFNFTTIAEQAKYIEGLDQNQYISIKPTEDHEFYPLSSSQKRIFVIKQLEGEEGISYNMPEVNILEGKLDLTRFEAAFRQLLRRHETLRTSFIFVENEPKQVVHSDVDFKIQYLTLPEPSGDVQIQIQKLVKEFVKPFDLQKAPLFKVGLIQVTETQHVLIFDMHHIISDGVSMNIIIQEFKQLYVGNELPDLQIQYKDFTVWQKRFYESEEMKEQEKYWVDMFNGEIPCLNLPTDYPRSSIVSFRGDHFQFIVDQSLTEELMKFVAKKDITLYIALLGAFKILINKYTGQRDIVVGSPVAGRFKPELENIIGMFVNTLPMRNIVQKGQTIDQFFDILKQNTLNAFENQNYPLEQLIDKLNLNRDLSRNPLFDVALILQNTGRVELKFSDLQVQSYSIENNIAKFDLALYVVQETSEIRLNFEYKTSLFKRDTIEMLSRLFLKVIREIVENQDVVIDELQIITETELQIWEDFNKTMIDYPKDKTLHQLFEEQVARTPDHSAVSFDGQTLTYQELNAKANQLARLLIERGVRSQDQVGLVMERNLEMFVGLLGILKAGGAYVPVDPEYPVARQEYIMENAQVSTIVTNVELELAVDHIVKVDFNQLKVYSKMNLDLQKDAGDIAYIIYTSGSTGLPKGVIIEHHSVVNLITWVNREFNIGVTDRLLFITSICFDLSVYDVFGTLAAGGMVVIATKSQVQNPEELSQLMIRERITFWDSVPTTMNHLISYFETTNPDYLQKDLRIVFLSGDWIPVQLPSRIKEYFTKTQVISLGGATEGTIWSIYYPIQDGEEFQVSIPYGRPLDNNYFYVLDQNQNLVPPGVEGELYIGGVGVANGYSNNSEQTAKSFMKNKFKVSKGERMYRTGDMGRLLLNGNIEFLGRIDSQVKIRGYRVECGEIENQLLTHKDIIEALVIDKENSNGMKFLCAYYISEVDLLISDLRNFLATKLPEYMIPSYFIKVDKIPLNTNGKVDRKALPALQTMAGLSKKEFKEPTNKIERTIVEIWQKILNKDRISILDNFFEVGGNSLLAVQAISNIEKTLGIKIPLPRLYQSPTIIELASHINREQDETNKVDMFQIQLRLNQEFGEKQCMIKQYRVVESEYFVLYTDQEYEHVLMFLKEEFGEEWTPHYIFPLNLELNDELIVSIDQEAFADHLGLIREVKENKMYSLYELICSQMEQFEQKIKSGPVIDTFHCGFYQLDYIDANYRSAIFHEIKISNICDPELVRQSIQDLMNIQGVMRLCIVEEEDTFNFVEYNYVEDLHISILDISRYGLAEQVKMKKKLQAAIIQDVIKSDLTHHMLFKVAILQLNEKEFSILFSFDHHISDYELGRILEKYFEEYFSQEPFNSFDEITQYKKYLKDIEVNLSEGTISKFRNKENYQQFEKITKDFLTRYPARRPVIHSEPYFIEYFLDDETELVQPPLGFALYICAHVCGIVFDLEQVPLRILTNRRIFGKNNYYNTIGDFHDGLPVIIDRNKSLSPSEVYELYNSLEQELIEKQIHVESLGGSDEKIICFSAPFSFNYVGNISEENDRQIRNSKFQQYDNHTYPLTAYSVDSKKLALIFPHGIQQENVKKVREFLKTLNGTYSLVKTK